MENGERGEESGEESLRRVLHKLPPSLTLSSCLYSLSIYVNSFPLPLYATPLLPIKPSYICATAVRCLSSCERFALTASHAVVSEGVQKRWFLSVVGEGVGVGAEAGADTDASADTERHTQQSQEPPQHPHPQYPQHPNSQPKLKLQLAPGANLYGAIELSQVPFTLSYHNNSTIIPCTY
jgi:hypothetical protein